MAEEFVPREFVYRKKHFGVPIGRWFRSELRTMLREHSNGTRDWSVQLWPLLIFRLWYRAFAP